jgi:hypothetical protein
MAALAKGSKVFVRGNMKSEGGNVGRRYRQSVRLFAGWASGQDLAAPTLPSAFHEPPVPIAESSPEGQPRIIVPRAHRIYAPDVYPRRTRRR